MKSTFCYLITLSVLALSVANPDPTCFKLPNAKHPLDCCNEPKLFPAELFTKCAQAHPPQPMPPPSGKIKGSCMAECVLNATKINVDGIPNGEKAIEVIDKAMNNDPDFMPVVKKAIHDCGTMAKGLQPYFQEVMSGQDDGQQVCHPQSGFLIGCFYGKVFTGCPASKWTSNGECDDIKKHVDRCKFMFPEIKP